MDQRPWENGGSVQAKMLGQLRENEARLSCLEERPRPWKALKARVRSLGQWEPRLG